MNDGNDNVITLCIIGLVILCSQIVTILEFKKIVERHSVHPIHGMYDQKALGCSPWDACRPDDKCRK